MVSTSYIRDARGGGAYRKDTYACIYMHTRIYELGTSLVRAAAAVSGENNCDPTTPPLRLSNPAWDAGNDGSAEEQRRDYDLRKGSNSVIPQRRIEEEREKEREQKDTAGAQPCSWNPCIISTYLAGACIYPISRGVKCTYIPINSHFSPEEKTASLSNAIPVQRDHVRLKDIGIVCFAPSEST